MKKQVLSALLTFHLSLAFVAGTVPLANASEDTSSIQELYGAATAASSANANKQNYRNINRWSSPVTSYLYENQDGGLTRVEYLNSKVIIEDYDSQFHLLSTKEIDKELPLWGGFFAGKDYNFLVFGQQNSEENNNKEVIRVVKYSKDWQREGSASLYGANTTVPFDAGSLRMTQYKDMLYIRTSHTMYASSDGLNHQANLTFCVKISSMTITDQFSGVMNTGCGYVSHSFNQFITTDNGTLLAVDHGDAYPRSVVLLRYKKAAGNDTFTDGYNYCDYINVLPIKGSIGANDTGVSVGGFTVSDTSYLVAGNSVPQDNTYNASGTRNIFVTSTPKNQFRADQTEIHWITNYSSGDQTSVSNPHMIKINDQQFLLLYTVNEKINYVCIDGKGNKISDICTMDGMLSDCQPVLYNDQIVWYYTNNSAPSFCAIPLHSASQASKSGWQFTGNHWYYFDPADSTMKTGWQLINNYWYYLDPADGTMKTGWQLINGKWYYLDLTNGNCFINTTTPDGYMVDESGAWIQ